ncbi:MAG: thioredoxin-dependent thiol peroxidase [Candidatus Woesearchaeota archaeon]|nr:thioredoxin-dependent thiol peroxidase [Candidatus Woesearchaeota archaeon]
MLKEGDKAPDFSLYDQAGKVHDLRDYPGKLVLYFYPKDDTPGCTMEACSFRDDLKEFKKKNISVLGISGDTVDSHERFADKYSLSFPILSDVEKKMSRDYGAYGEKKFMGRIFMGINRITFLIEEGTIKKIYQKVDVKRHSQDILAEYGNS